MAEYQDYYTILGVPREASQDEIRKAYRKLARKYHPDVSKEPGAAERFKQINEANEVLKDPEKRKRYDTLGQNWRQGQEFRPPPDWGREFGFGAQGGFGRAGRASAGAFSSFFEELFGGMGGGGAEWGGGFQQAFREQPAAQEAEVVLPLELVYTGGAAEFGLSQGGGAPDAARRLEVKIPPGTKEGSTIRLAARGERPELLLRVRIQPHAAFRVHDYDLATKVSVPAWDAALGAEVALLLPDGKELQLKIPAGMQSGTRLRVRGRGLIKHDRERGDLYVEVQATVPRELSPEEKRLWQQLRERSTSRPEIKFAA